LDEFKAAVSREDGLNHQVVLNSLDSGEDYWFSITCSDPKGTDIRSKDFFFWTRGIGVGKFAPDLTLKDIYNNDISLSSAYYKPVAILTFWSKSCTSCIYQMKFLKEIHGKYGDSAVSILAINSKDDVKTIRTIIEEQEVFFTVLLDSSGELMELYKPPVIPTTYFIMGKMVKYIKRGYFSSTKEIEDIINSINPYVKPLR
jgi:peroxiredoxin